MTKHTPTSPESYPANLHVECKDDAEGPITGAHARGDVAADLRAKVAALAAAFRSDGDPAPTLSAICEYARANAPTLGAQQDLYMAIYGLCQDEIAAERAEAKRAADDAWQAPEMPIDAIERLLEQHRPASLEGLLAAHHLDLVKVEGDRIGIHRERGRRGELQIPAYADDSEEHRNAIRLGIGLVVVEAEGLPVPPKTVTASEWLRDIGDEVETRIVEGWTPPVPRTPAELAEAVAGAIAEESVEALARRLIRFGATDDRQRAVRLVRAFRERIAAERAELDYVGRMLDAIERGDVPQARVMGDAAIKALPLASQVTHGVIYLAEAIDPERADSLDREPLAGAARDAVRWPHKGELQTAALAALDRRMLAALAGTHVDELRLEKEVA